MKKVIVNEYPKFMVKGNAYTPYRFWEVKSVKNAGEEKKLREKGFIEKKF